MQILVLHKVTLDGDDDDDDKLEYIEAIQEQLNFSSVHYLFQKDVWVTVEGNWFPGQVVTLSMKGTKV